VAERVTFRWQGDAWLAGARRAAAHGIELGLEHVLAESNKRVPLDEATLERSGKVSVDPVALAGAVSYDTVYAIRQHEELTWKHLPGRSAKYLEIPFNEQTPMVLAIIAAEIRRSGTGGGFHG
jgi:hypothetical protein